MKGLITSIDSNEQPKGRITYIIRHGQTKLNVKDVIRGWSDVPLDEVGLEQARILGEEMYRDGIELDGLISSDLLRSVQTSLEISKETGIPLLETTKALRPWDAGSYTEKDGKTVHKIMMDLARNNPDEQLGGGESFNVFKHRILGGIIATLNSHRGLKLGLVSHSRGERVMHAWATSDYDPDLDIDLDVFGEKGENTATAQEFLISCPLILS